VTSVLFSASIVDGVCGQLQGRIVFRNYIIRFVHAHEVQRQCSAMIQALLGWKSGNREKQNRNTLAAFYSRHTRWNVNVILGESSGNARYAMRSTPRSLAQIQHATGSLKIREMCTTLRATDTRHD
jgi:hypothetical protein